MSTYAYVVLIFAVLPSNFTMARTNAMANTARHSLETSHLFTNERGNPLPLSSMSSTPQSDPVALQLAEDVLRHIYGEDLKGCAVSLESVASIIARGIIQQQRGAHELLDLYEKLVEALHLLSSPPGGGKIGDPAEWQQFLSQRLDSIHVLTTKAMETTARIRPKTSS